MEPTWISLRGTKLYPRWHELLHSTNQLICIGLLGIGQDRGKRHTCHVSTTHISTCIKSPRNQRPGSHLLDRRLSARHACPEFWGRHFVGRRCPRPPKAPRSCHFRTTRAQIVPTESILLPTYCSSFDGPSNRPSIRTSSRFSTVGCSI